MNPFLSPPSAFPALRFPIFLPLRLRFRLRLPLRSFLVKERSPHRARNPLRHKILNRSPRMKVIPPQTANPIQILACGIRGTVPGWVSDGEVEGGLGVEECGFGVFVCGGEGVDVSGEEGVVG